MNIIKNKKTDIERAYYGTKDTYFECIEINGIRDGESAFKESSNIQCYDCKFFLRYPFWHNSNLEVKKCTFASTARAAFWYDKNVNIDFSFSQGVKAFRECENITMTNSDFDSEEIFWRCNKINVSNSHVGGMYAFFQSKDITLKQVNFTGKYSFQYVENMNIDTCSLDTKDAFWHSKNVTVYNSTIKGEYLGWYAENLTLVNCHIEGTQPLCYVKNLKLVNCTFTNCDLAFEYSEVNGNINGTIVSIKNPLSGKVTIDCMPELIQDDFDKSNGNFSIELTKMKVLK